MAELVAFHAHSIVPVIEVELEILLRSIVAGHAKPCVLLPEGEPVQRTVGEPGTGDELALAYVPVAIMSPSLADY